MTALSTRVSVLKTGLIPRILGKDNVSFDRKLLDRSCRCFSSQGFQLEQTPGPGDKNPSTETKEPRMHDSHKNLSLFQKRLLYTSGKYDSIAAVPNKAGETELRYATDICKTLFNIWCMVFLTAFAISIHIIEKRRMSRTFARLERKEKRKMAVYDKINQETQEKLKRMKANPEAK